MFDDESITIKCFLVVFLCACLANSQALMPFEVEVGDVNKRVDPCIDFFEYGLHHNGALVLGESIADLAGIKIAYLAFEGSQQGRPPGAMIDGFTPEQQVFISFAQTRGDATRLEKQRLMVQTDEHPVAKFRVIGPLSNMPEFQQAFACKKGCAMVRSPEERCAVW